MNAMRCTRLRNASILYTHTPSRPSPLAEHRILQLRWLASKAPRTLRSSNDKATPLRNRYASRPSQHQAPQDEQSHPIFEEEQQQQEKQDNPNEQPPRRATLRDIRRSIAQTLIFFLAGHYIATHHYALTFPQGPSMLPTISVRGSCVLISRSYRHGHGIQVGDLVTALHPMFPEGSAVLKRVVGMPGDFVWVEAGRMGEWEWEFEEEGEGGGRGRYVQVPMGHCWLSGDNARHSRDSRHYGAVPLGLVTGKVTYRIWPWSQRGEFARGLEEVDEVVV